jgi:glycosyltransferase involved in cell wall biosynthesis
LYDHYPILDRDTVRKILEAGDLFIYLFFGLLRPYKGVIHLIHAFERLPADITRKSLLLIVGETWEDRESAEAASLSPVADRIRMVGRYVSDEEVPIYFSAADVLVLPYTRASQSGVAHIGISYGLPVIASRVGGIAESLDGYEGTRFVPPRDEASLTWMMEQVYHDERTRNPVPEHLRWETVCENYSQLLRKMTGGVL